MVLYKKKVMEPDCILNYIFLIYYLYLIIYCLSRDLVNLLLL